MDFVCALSCLRLMLPVWKAIFNLIIISYWNAIGLPNEIIYIDLNIFIAPSIVFRDFIK